MRVLRLVEDLATEPVPGCLTGREVDVLRLLAAGCSNQEIGARLHISANTAANHVRSILTKTGAANRTQAAVYAAARHLA
ncbi:MAG TPA: LuxR C-terminal-related transcriptional regulator [Acidimicrobiales bacterium]|nr:LuxR C-terminal-related transcriptional regulator [Acidimicrobiales bacterium]